MNWLRVKLILEFKIIKLILSTEPLYEKVDIINFWQNIFGGFLSFMFVIDRFFKFFK
jgi:hypothetical protein